MKKTIAILSIAIGLVFVSPCLRADDLSALAGKWVAEGTDSEGAVKRVLEIKQDKFTYQILRAGDRVVLYARGNVKLEKLGPFQTARYYNIEGGASATELQPADDDRTVIYTLVDNEMTVAANFDRERSEPPSAVKYTRVARESSGGLVIDRIVMHTTPQAAEWYFCFDATVGETTRRFNLPDKTWSKDEVTLITDLSIPGARKDQACKFVMKLDDVAGDECSDEMDNRSAGAFTVTESGSQMFKPEGHWRYTIYWHLK